MTKKEKIQINNKDFGSIPSKEKIGITFKNVKLLVP